MNPRQMQPRLTQLALLQVSATTYSAHPGTCAAQPSASASTGHPTPSSAAIPPGLVHPSASSTSIAAPSTARATRSLTSKASVETPMPMEAELPIVLSRVAPSEM